MSAKAGKRPLRALSVHEKLDAIRRVSDGESKAAVARDIGVPESTLRGWCKNKEKISSMSRQSSSPETDCSAESKVKRQKTSPVAEPQPFNLSVKPMLPYPASDSRYVPAKRSVDINTTLANLTSENLKYSTNSTDNEKHFSMIATLINNLKRAEPYTTTPHYDLATLAEWATVWYNYQNRSSNQKIDEFSTNSAASSITNLPTSTSVKVEPNSGCNRSPTEKNTKEDHPTQWMNTHSNVGSLPQNSANYSQFNGGPSSSSVSPSCTSSGTHNERKFTNPYHGISQESIISWYKAASLACLPNTFSQVLPLSATEPNLSSLNSSSNAEKPILYQQLTKEKDQMYAEDLSVSHIQSEKNCGSDGSRSAANASPSDTYTSGFSTPSPTNINISAATVYCSNFAASDDYDPSSVIRHQAASISNERNNSSIVNGKGLCSNTQLNDKIRKRKSGIDSILANLDNNNGFTKNGVNGNLNTEESTIVDWKTAVQCGEYFLKFVEDYHKNHSAVNGPTHFEVSCIRKAISKIKANGETKEN